MSGSGERFSLVWSRTEIAGEKIVFFLSRAGAKVFQTSCRVVVQDIEESLFRLFLDYIYGAHLNLRAMPVQEIVELLVVADRYEVEQLIMKLDHQVFSCVCDLCRLAPCTISAKMNWLRG